MACVAKCGESKSLVLSHSAQVSLSATDRRELALRFRIWPTGFRSPDRDCRSDKSVSTVRFRCKFNNWLCAKTNSVYIFLRT